MTTRSALYCAITMSLSVVTPAAAAPSTVAPSAASPVTGALQGQRVGLFAGSDFRLTSGKCSECATIPQALWYFQDEVIAVPRAGLPVSGYSTTQPGTGDIKAWAATAAVRTLAYPSLVWMGAPELLDDAVMAPDGQSVRAGEATLALRVVPKIPTNLSYFDASSRAFFGQRPVRLRGTLSDEKGAPTFTARTIWPRDYVIDQQALKVAPLAGKDTFRAFIQAEDGGAKSAYANRLIWQRTPGANVQWQGKPVLALMLNGAQGDDDEAFGGHFAVATGTLGPHGEWADLLANNYYTLDAYGEKGILAASVPMDNYLADLNSGQGYYRPSYMLVAVLSDARTASAYQGGAQRIYNHYYRHDLNYDGALQNCTGLSMDVFSALGWQIPRRGATHPLKALAAYPYKAVLDRSLVSGRKGYEYLSEEQTRLYPAVAFEAAGQDLLKLLAGQAGRALTPYEQQLTSDVDALILVRIPQFPSSRVFGSAPVFSYDEYMARTPANQADWKVIPVEPRPFPAQLRDGLAASQTPRSLLPWPVAAAGALVLVLLSGLAVWLRRAIKKPRKN